MYSTYLYFQLKCISYLLEKTHAFLLPMVTFYVFEKNVGLLK